MTSELKTYKTSKQNLAVYYEGYCFWKSHSLVSGDICWRCCSTGCPASVTTSLKIDCVKNYTNKHKKHGPHTTPENISSTKVRGSISSIKQQSRLTNRASLDSSLGSLRKPLCSNSYCQTDESILKSKDELLNRVQQLTETQSALVDEIQRLTLELENCSSENKTFREETDSLKKTVTSMSISIETMEADNCTLRNEVEENRKEADKWRTLHDNLCAASDEYAGCPIPLRNRFSLLSVDESSTTFNRTLENSQVQKTLSFKKQKTQYSKTRTVNSVKSSKKVIPRILDKTTVLSDKTNLKRQPNLGGMIKLFSASQGRILNELLSKRTDSRITSSLKPGACFDAVVSECDKECRSMSTCDLTVLMGGTNDCSRGCHESYLNTLQTQLQSLKHTRVFLVNVPRRYDLPFSSPVNAMIMEVNERLEVLVGRFDNVQLFDVHGLGRRFYTRHGLHINLIGKNIIADSIIGLFESSIFDSHCNITRSTTFNDSLIEKRPEYRENQLDGSMISSMNSEGDTLMDISTKSESIGKEIPVMIGGGRLPVTHSNFLGHRQEETVII